MLQDVKVYFTYTKVSKLIMCHSQDKEAKFGWHNQLENISLHTIVINRNPFPKQQIIVQEIATRSTFYVSSRQNMFKNVFQRRIAALFMQYLTV